MSLNIYERNIQDNILTDIENGKLYKNVRNASCLSDLFKYFNIIENVKKYIFSTANINKIFKEKLETMTLNEIKSSKDLSNYFNISDTRNNMFLDYVDKMKTSILESMDNGILQKFVRDITDYEELCQIFNTVEWFELVGYGQEIIKDYEDEECYMEWVSDSSSNIISNYSAQFELDETMNPKLVIYIKKE